jgi:hypothetical protein
MLRFHDPLRVRIYRPSGLTTTLPQTELIDHPANLAVSTSSPTDVVGFIVQGYSYQNVLTMLGQH